MHDMEINNPHLARIAKFVFACALWKTWKVLIQKQEGEWGVAVCFILSVWGRRVEDHQSGEVLGHQKMFRERDELKTKVGWKGPLGALLGWRAWGCYSPVDTSLLLGRWGCFYSAKRSLQF